MGSVGLTVCICSRVRVPLWVRVRAEVTFLPSVWCFPGSGSFTYFRASLVRSSWCYPTLKVEAILLPIYPLKIAHSSHRQIWVYVFKPTVVRPSGMFYSDSSWRAVTQGEEELSCCSVSLQRNPLNPSTQFGCSRDFRNGTSATWIDGWMDGGLLRVDTLLFLLRSAAPDLVWDTSITYGIFCAGRQMKRIVTKDGN